MHWARDSGRARAADTVVHRFDHRAYWQRLRQLHRLVRTPFTTIFMILLLIAMFYHTALGLQVVIEEYDHSGAKIPALVATRLGCFALAAAGIVATLRICL